MIQFSLNLRLTAITLATAILLASCSSSTLITTTPNDAKLYLNGEYVGVTPYRHSDTKIMGSTTHVKIEKDGYEPLHSAFARDEEADVGAIVGGLFFLFPFLWAMKYKATHAYELTPLQPGAKTETKTPASASGNQEEDQSASATKKLKQLKEMLDNGVITKAEYDAKRAKILEDI